MLTRLSILIPTFNTVCVPLVRTLAAQAEAVDGLEYEIIVADDGSTDAETVAENDAINEMPHCRYVKNAVNIGRSAIRNALGMEAEYEWLLFLDSDVEVHNPHFLHNYLAVSDMSLKCERNAFVSQKESLRAPKATLLAANGGLILGSKDCFGNLEGNLRYRYEKSCERRYSAAQRAKHPYQSFRSTNFMISKEAFERCKFDESVTTYGYEDVLLGKALRDNGIEIAHIDNPVVYTKYEDNAAFLAKTEEAMRTLHALTEPLCGFSKIIKTYRKLRRYGMTKLFYTLYIFRKRAWRGNLLSSNPSLFLFKLYKLGYFISVHTRP